LWSCRGRISEEHQVWTRRRLFYFVAHARTSFVTGCTLYCRRGG
jgi:hypothetical protein